MKRWIGTMAAVAVAIGSSMFGNLSESCSSTTCEVGRTTGDGTSQLSQQSGITLGPVARGTLNVTVDDSRSFQTNVGLGAAFTDSSTYLMENLKANAPSQYSSMMNKLFSTSSGIGIAFWRMPMTASDFNSTGTPWTDDDVQGPTNTPTQNFGLTAQDTGHIIPVIKDALAINPSLKIFASPWSPPAWMKSNTSMICNTGSGNASLLSTFYQAWADYFVKWIQAYQSNGIPIWAVTPQNEPLYCPTNYPGSSWDPASEANWVHNFLKPSLGAAGLSPAVLGFDHNWDALYFPQQLLTSQAAGDFAAMAWNCYDNNSEPTMTAAIHNQYSGIDEYETECSSDTNPTDIIPYTTAQMALLSYQNWAKGIVLWNVALDQNNGPHLGGCMICVPVVTVLSNSYTLLNNYYQLGQISNFVPGGPTRIASTVNAHGVFTVAFKNSNIVDVKSGLAPEDTNGSTSNGTVMQQWALNSGSSNQQWQINSVGGGYYTVTNRTSGLVLDLTGGGLGDGINIQQWAVSSGDINQQFQLIGTPRAAATATPASRLSVRNVSHTTGKPLGDAHSSTSH